MASSLRYFRRTQRDRLSINVIPEQSRDVEPQSPYLHWLFGESSEVDMYSRLVDDDFDGTDDGTGYSKADAVIMKEITAWLELREHDEFWVTKNKHANTIFLPTTSQLLARLRDADSSLAYASSGIEAFDALVQTITLQLLASCYTFLPASSASHLPLFQQRTSKKLVTALRAHACHRLTPAAGHQARAPSETSAWPGLYTGPEPEDAMAETVTQRRRSAKYSSVYTSSFAATEWTDGANDSSRRERGSPSSSSFETGIFTRLSCQPSTPRKLNRKHNAVLSRTLFCSRNKGERNLLEEHPCKKSHQKVAIHAVQRTPSIMHLRHMQSNPHAREAANHGRPTSESSPWLVCRTSPDPSIGSKWRYDFDIPEISKVTATPNASRNVKSPLPMRGVERGDMISAHDYLDKTKIGGPLWFSARQSQAEGKNEPTLDEGYFNTANPALLQNDNREQGVDEIQPRFFAVKQDDRKTEYHHEIDDREQQDFDRNGQIAADRRKDEAYGTERYPDYLWGPVKVAWMSSNENVCARICECRDW